MLENVQVLCHSSIRIQGNKVVYIDPFQIKKQYHDADYIFCTHSHYDHFSPEDIEKVKKDDTQIILVESAEQEAEKRWGKENLLVVKPEEKRRIGEIEFQTTYAYNLQKPFHPKENEWVGYLLQIEGMRYYVAGDTDNIPEIRSIQCDVAFLPVGGKYTMDIPEAAELVKTIEAKIIVPIHYGSIVGTVEDGKKFAQCIKDKMVKLYI